MYMLHYEMSIYTVSKKLHMGRRNHKDKASILRLRVKSCPVETVKGHHG